MAGGKERGTVGKEGEGEGRYFSPFLFPLSTFSPRFFFLSVSFLFFSFRKSPCYSFLFILQASVHTKEKGRGEEKVDEVELSFFFVSLSREEREKRKQGGLSLSLSLSHLSPKKKKASDRTLACFLPFSLSLSTSAEGSSLLMAPPAGLSGPTGGEGGGSRGGGGAANQGRNANSAPNAAAATAAAGAPSLPPHEEPLADGGILPRDAALVKGLLRSMVRESEEETRERKSTKRKRR